VIITETTNKVEPQKKYTAKEFAASYQKLCEEYGFRIVVSPAFASTNHGTFEVVLQYTIGELPKQ
jgi:hypothetical protein